MDETLRVGRLAGVRIGVNWTVLVIFLLIFVGLAAGQFPLSYPDRSWWAYALAGGIAALVFFASLLAHELAHAVLARRHGIAVEGIVLWLFGGVARFRSEARDAGSDLRIAGVGPLVSLVLGLMFGLATWVVLALGGGGLVVGVLGWLALINVALALFNLFPAAPLDGGRILRAVLWRWHGDRTRAAVTAARAGRVFGIVLIGLGLAQVVFGPGFGGIWLMLIGWFLTGAATAEEQQTRVQDALGDVLVGEVMSADPMTVEPTLSVADFLESYLLRTRYSTFPVVDDAGRPVGLVTLNRTRGVDAGQRSATRVADIACALDEIPRTRRDERIVDLLPRLAGCSDGRALVIEDDRVVGIVSPTDVSRLLEVSSLRPREGGVSVGST